MFTTRMSYRVVTKATSAEVAADISWNGWLLGKNNVFFKDSGTKALYKKTLHLFELSYRRNRTPYLISGLNGAIEYSPPCSCFHVADSNTTSWVHLSWSLECCPQCQISTQPGPSRTRASGESRPYVCFVCVSVARGRA
jgi:hypothetical protein